MRIAVIERESIHHDAGYDVSQQQQAEVLTLYDILPNWRNTIAVPGCPPIWSPPPLPTRIPADKDHDPRHPRPPAAAEEEEAAVEEEELDLPRRCSRHPRAQAEQLWFSRTSILIIGCYEDGGYIVEVEQRDVEKTGWLKKWELTNTEKLQKLVKVLEMMRTVMVVRGGRFAFVTQKGQSTLSVYEMQKSSQFGLPEDIKAGWK
ncbi:hypothetical protein BZA05DRAFT_455710 [Tricharina praecox]|uniref:uncharacterized protein n=1 Tax=Tricharina praecox TaxID=43433 RepID=UPI0022210650|nr:uncharacterized protein BZA05DRAFT_455710 [Tricharina praecox]KAI5848345.1 hypothetical protein BZA05DRAFT_455710 [Tricharina praecox]